MVLGIEQETASIVKFLHDNHSVKLFYDDEITEDMEVPSMYFPMPELMSAIDTVESFKNTYSWYINIFDIDTRTALHQGKNLSNIIWNNKLKIPLIDEQGERIRDKSLKLKSVSLEKIDNGVAQLNIKWSTCYLFTKDTTLKLKSFKLDTIIKGG